MASLSLLAPAPASAVTLKATDTRKPKSVQLKQSGKTAATGIAGKLVLEYRKSLDGTSAAAVAQRRNFTISRWGNDDEKMQTLTYRNLIPAADRSVGTGAITLIRVSMRRSDGVLEPESVEDVNVTIKARGSGKVAPRLLYEAWLARDSAQNGWYLSSAYGVEGKPRNTQPLRLPGISSRGFGIEEKWSLSGFKNVVSQLGAVANEVLIGGPVGYVLPPETPGMTNGYNERSANALRRGLGDF